MRTFAQRPVRIGARLAAVLLGTALAVGGPASFGASSGTLAFSLDPDTTVMGPGDSTVVTVSNTSPKKSTTALVATLTNPTRFQMVDGCSGVALGPGKQCQITVTNLLGSTPASDQAATLTVGGKKAGTTSPLSVTFVVPGSGCRVTNAETVYTDLQQAIDAAASGDTLGVEGTCFGNFTIAKELTLQGITGAGTPTLDAQLVGVTLRIAASGTVTLRDVTVTGGTGGGGAAFGGGIENDGVLTLSGSTSVSENAASVGGGIVNSGVVTMNDTSTVSGNSVQAGAGILNDELATLTMNDSSSVTGNSALLQGGGIGSSGTVTMNDSSVVSGNATGGDGGGIIGSGPVTMNGSASVWGNSAEGQGGGILVYDDAPLAGAVAGGNVYDNTPDDIALFVEP